MQIGRGETSRGGRRDDRVNMRRVRGPREKIGDEKKEGLRWWRRDQEEQGKHCIAKPARIAESINQSKILLKAGGSRDDGGREDRSEVDERGVGLSRLGAARRRTVNRRLL